MQVLPLQMMLKKPRYFGRKGPIFGNLCQDFKSKALVMWLGRKTNMHIHKRTELKKLIKQKDLNIGNAGNN